MKKIIISLVLIVAALLIYLFVPNNNRAPVKETPAPEEQPAKAGKENLIIVDSPLPNTLIKSPLTISGQARGNWYFEASFPITLLDENGKVLTEHYATAQGEWMTENFVPFTSTLNFEVPRGTTKGTLILKKDNPSGLPENDDSVSIPVVFAE